MSRPLRMLIVEDSEDDTLLLVRELRRGGYDPTFERVETAEGMNAALEKHQWDIVIADYAMPQFSAIDALGLFKEKGLEAPFFIVSGAIDEETAVAAMRAGAHDYIMKDHLGRLIPAIDRELRQAEVRRQRERAENAMKKAHDELEQRVEERTAELVRTAEQLRVELAERKRAEEALRIAHKDIEIKASDLESAYDELSQYSHVVAHVLKAPLRSIHNYADFLSEDLGTTLSAEQTDVLENLGRAVRQGVELVDGLLDFASLDRRSRQNHPTNIGAFLHKLVKSLDYPPDVEVVMGDDWPTIDTDPTALQQVFENLIRNAVTFNQSQRKRIEIGWLPLENEHCEVFVRDNGIGIESRYHDQIFGVFARLHTRDEYEGLGLGLAVVKKGLAKLHGSIRIESKVGKGSTFFVTLPNTQQGR